MEFSTILYSTKNQIATITLNIPERLNPFTEEMSRNVINAVNIAEKDDDVKVIVINANGKSFSGGGDISEMFEAMKEGRNIFGVTADLIAQVSSTILKCKKPVIASVSGAVAGAAFNISIACDFCIAADNTKFIQAFTNLGLVPDAGGMFVLTRALGLNRARHLAMLNAPVTAEEGKELGFVYKVCPVENLAEETEKLALKLAKGPSKSYELIKMLTYQSQFNTAYEEYTEKEIEAQVMCGYTEDYKEGITAFIEKRKPVFTGK
jgi:trans-2-decenoyl-[acyl-carrier protein] isomerase